MFSAENEEPCPIKAVPAQLGNFVTIIHPFPSRLVQTAKEGAYQRNNVVESKLKQRPMADIPRVCNAANNDKPLIIRISMPIAISIGIRSSTTPKQI